MASRMAKIGRLILAVLAGTVLWGVLWNLGTLGGQALLPALMAPEQPVTHAGVLVGLIVYSVVLSILAGWVTAALAGARPMPAVWVLAALQLAIGIAVEVAYWRLMPAWYHLIFLVLVVPATVWGGRRRAGRQGS